MPDHRAFAASPAQPSPDPLRALSDADLLAQWAAGGDARPALESVLLARACGASLRARHSLAQAIVAAGAAPQVCLVALLAGPRDIAALIGSRAQGLRDADLAHGARHGDAEVQAAIARRKPLSAALAQVLATEASLEAQIALLANDQAALTEATFHTLFGRFGDTPRLREALLRRSDCPAAIRCQLVVKAAALLQGFVSRCGWMTPERAAGVAEEETSRAFLGIAHWSARPEIAAPLADHLRTTHRLTAGFLLRCLLSNDRLLFAQALADLACVPVARAVPLVAEWRGAGFASLLRRARVPASLLPVMRAALRAQEEAGWRVGTSGGDLSASLIRRVIALMQPSSLPDVDAAIRRLLVEAVARSAQPAGGVALGRSHRNATLDIDLDAIEAELCAA